MKGKLLWFGIGVVIGAIALSILHRVRHRPIDFRPYTTPEFAEMVTNERDVDWLRATTMTRVGNLIVVTPSVTNVGQVMIMPFRKPYGSIIWVNDAHGKGGIAGVQILDGKRRLLTLVDRSASGAFDFMAFAPDIGLNPVSFADTNMDGTFDVTTGMRTASVHKSAP